MTKLESLKDAEATRRLSVPTFGKKPRASVQKVKPSEPPRIEIVNGDQTLDIIENYYGINYQGFADDIDLAE